MRNNMTLNMTEGKPLKLLSVFALPLLIGYLFQQAYNLADSMIVGRLLGADALAAVGATGSISFLLFSIFNGNSWCSSPLAPWAWRCPPMRGRTKAPEK